MRTCMVCVAKYGFRLSDTDRIFDTEEQLLEHLEDWHGTPVMREGESEGDAAKRCAAKGIVPDRAECKCRDCRELRGDEVVMEET